MLARTEARVLVCSAINAAIAPLFNQQEKNLRRMAVISLSTAGEVHQDIVLVVFDVNINAE